ncbi:hypothetical protein QVD17_32635 [Tagetes erecta]|uniref:Transmembrane protein n=1 Tax=Tagetes erecta TaxID=13708 RepID=A0AAD8NK63_TARER|nr:hypothetical protein QVD17_32635 [Tagetes erecta]
MAPRRESRSLNKRKVDSSTRKSDANKSGRQICSKKMGVLIVAFSAIVFVLAILFAHHRAKMSSQAKMTRSRPC